MQKYINFCIKILKFCEIQKNISNVHGKVKKFAPYKFEEVSQCILDHLQKKL